MNRATYEEIMREALLQAEAARDPISAAAIRYDAARRIPRFPSFLPLHFQLLWPVASEPLEVAPRLWADAAVFMTRLGLLAGLVDTAEEFAERLEVVARQRQDARMSACSSLARGLVLAARERLPGAQAEIREAQKTLAGDPENAAWLAVAQAALALTAQDPVAAEQRLDELLHILPASPEWDGERHDAWQKKGFLFMQADRLEEAVTVLEQAREVARVHGAQQDAWLCLISMTPILLVTNEANRAVSLLDEALAEAVAAKDSREFEMAMRNLKMRALDRLGDLGRAIEAGFQAIERCGVTGTLDDYAMFVVETASLYQRAGANLDAYHVLALARMGLRARGEAGAGPLQAVQTALDALRDDLGVAEFERLAAEAARLNPALAGETE